MAGIMQTGIRTPKHIRDGFYARWAGILSLLPVGFVARLAVHREILRRRNALARTLGFALDLVLDQFSGNPLYCVRVRHELQRQLRLQKRFPPGWRKACFQASARRFGPLT